MRHNPLHRFTSLSVSRCHTDMPKNGTQLMTVASTNQDRDRDLPAVGVDVNRRPPTMASLLRN